MPSTTTPKEEATDYVKQLVENDDRTQRRIAAEAGFTPPQLTHLKNGRIGLNFAMARKLGRAFPEQADRLWELSEAIYDYTDEALEEGGALRTLWDDLRKHLHVTLTPCPTAAV